MAPSPRGLLAGSCLFFTSLLLTACDSGQQQADTPPPAVTVYTVASQPVGNYREFVARTAASQEVDLRARVDADMWGGMPGMGHSGAARAGMVNFTQTAAVEWGVSGVRVNAVAPGWIASSGMDNYPEHMKQWIRSLGDNVPIKRMGTESEVSAAICFLLSPGASFVNGDCLRIDGGGSQGGRVWPLPKAKNNEPFNGFHRAVTPKVLSED